MDFLSAENVMHRIDELQKDTDEQLKILDDINKSFFLKFIWHLFKGNFKKAYLRAENNIKSVDILLDYLYDIE
jgi:hypothetical protein